MIMVKFVLEISKASHLCHEKYILISTKFEWRKAFIDLGIECCMIGKRKRIPKL